MSGLRVGVSGGTGVGWPGCEGCGTSGRGSSGVAGGCCIFESLLSRGTPVLLGGLPSARRVAQWRMPVIGRAPFRRPRGRGEIGRRAGFRFQWETVGVRVPPPAPAAAVAEVAEARLFRTLAT